jgi:phosphoserine aminotransferase
MRVHNFGAGPCTLPLEVLEEAQSEFLDFAGSGMSVIELSHRSPVYEAVHDEALALAREVAGAPADIEVLFIQGGATLQFSMVPLNLLRPGQQGAYVVSGSWGRRAFEDGALHGEVYAAWDGKSSGYTTMPQSGELALGPDTRYLHVTTNETIGGIRLVDLPDTDLPLVADMSSDYLARPIAWNRYDLVYGGVQKNLGPAGMAVVFVRKTVLEESPHLGSFLQYRWHADTRSLGHTPPMFTIYLMGKVLKRLQAQGGVAGLERASAAKAERLYRVIDEGYFQSPVDPRFRSHMNVVFRLPTEEAEKKFLTEAAAVGMVGLKGHRSVGGCRASLYAALPMQSVEILAAFMEQFRSANS